MNQTTSTTSLALKPNSVSTSSVCSSISGGRGAICSAFGTSDAIARCWVRSAKFGDRSWYTIKSNSLKEMRHEHARLLDALEIIATFSQSCGQAIDPAFTLRMAPFHTLTRRISQIIPTMFPEPNIALWFGFVLPNGHGP
jgi:hypothetical protein